jgi:molybdenum cofactor guanylyltransferase
LRRLAPQVASVAVNANRQLDDYARFAVPVWPDTLADRPGPLAGMLAGLARCATPFLATVPCDSPRFPLDLVARLGAAFDADDVDIAIAATPHEHGARLESVFCLMRVEVRASLEAFLARGERKVEAWARAQRLRTVVFDDATAFFNVNTPADLRRLAADE